MAKKAATSKAATSKKSSTKKAPSKKELAMQKAVEAAIDTMSRSFYKHSLCSEGKEAVQALAKAAGVSIDKFTGTPVTMEMETPEFVVPGASDENGIDQDDFDTEGSITLIHRKSKKRFVFKADDLLYGIRQ